MKITTIALIFTLSVTSITSVTAQAEGSAQHSGQASKHSVLAVGHGALSTVKVASAVVAVPVVVAGSVVVADHRDWSASGGVTAAVLHTAYSTLVGDLSDDHFGHDTAR